MIPLSTAMLTAVPGSPLGVPVLHVDDVADTRTDARWKTNPAAQLLTNFEPT